MGWGLRANLGEKQWVLCFQLTCTEATRPCWLNKRRRRGRWLLPPGVSAPCGKGQEAAVNHWPPELSIIWPGCGVGELGVPSPPPFSGGGGNRGVPTELALPCRPRRWQVVVVGWGRVTGRVTWGEEGREHTGRVTQGCPTSAMATLVVSGAAVTLRMLLVSPPLRPARLVRLPSTCGMWTSQDAAHGDMRDMAPMETCHPRGDITHRDPPARGCSPGCWGRLQAMGMHHPLGHVFHGGPATMDLLPRLKLAMGAKPGFEDPSYMGTCHQWGPSAPSRLSLVTGPP